MIHRFNKLTFMFVLMSCALVMGVKSGYAQTKISITNKSFEDIPAKGVNFFNLNGWTDCGGYRFNGESPPDIHPGNFWENTIKPSEGRTYIGMVVRDNESWEGIAQRLNSTLKVGKCYKFTIDLARSDKYLSKSRLTNKDIHYVTPAVFRIWGGNGICDERELLGESSTIAHAEWRTYQFKVKPKAEYKYIMIEAFYKVPVVLPYCGHILVDNLSDFDEMDCSAPLPPVVNKKTGSPILASGDNLPPHKKNRVEQSKDKSTTTTSFPPANTPATPSPKAKILVDLDVNKIKMGSTIEIKNLYFKADTSTIDKSSFAVLDEIAGFLKTNQKIKMEIGGHTNGIPSHIYCDKLSSDRAKVVYDYLLAKGVAGNQITYKGYGKRRRIATDSTAEGRNKNQRVELKVLSVG